MKVLWINPCFLDYRVPVYVELDRLLHGKLTVVYSKDHTPERVWRRLEGHLQDRAIGLLGQRQLHIGNVDVSVANKSVTIPFQPRLLSTVVDIDADVTIAEGFFQWTPAAIYKRLRRQSALVISYERTKHTERNCPWWRQWYRKVIVRLADAMLCNGRLCSEYSQSLGMPASRIVTGGMAADSDIFRSQSQLVTSSEKRERRLAEDFRSPIFLYAGQMIDRKGVVELTLGWQAYVNRGGSGSLVLVGDGPVLSRLRRMATDKCIPRLHFFGHVPYTELPGIYALADVFVIATLEDNWSLVVPEAMASGLPVGCSKYNGCWPELIDEGQNGTVFDPLNHEDVVRCFRFFEERIDSLTSMGARSREIELHYTPQNAAIAALKACEIAIAQSQKDGRSVAGDDTVAVDRGCSR